MNVFSRTIFYFVLILPCLSDKLLDVQKLQDDIFIHGNYNKLIRGVLDQTKTVRVAANFSLISVSSILETEDAFEAMGILNIRWFDERLLWKPEDYNGTTELILHHDMIWRPEVTLANSLLDIHTLSNDRIYTRIHHSGKITWTKRHLFKATCEINVVSFPWDRQSCALTFIVSGYSRNEVLIDIDQQGVDLSLFEGHGSWRLIKTAVLSAPRFNSEIQYWFCVERMSAFHISVVFFPVVTLSILSLFAFVVKIDSGERISFSVTLLLSLTVDLTVMSDVLPTHSKGMASIVFYLNSVLGESALICLISIINLHMYHKDGEPPFFLRRLFGVFYCKRFVRVIEVSQEKHEEPKEIKTDLKNEETKDNISDISEPIITWMEISRLLDKVCFIVASFSLIIFYLVFGIDISLKSGKCLY